MVAAHRTPEPVNHDWKQAVVNDFLRGQSVARIAEQSFCHKLRVEQVIREAVGGLVKLTATPQTPYPGIAPLDQSHVD